MSRSSGALSARRLSAKVAGSHFTSIPSSVDGRGCRRSAMMVGSGKVWFVHTARCCMSRFKQRGESVVTGRLFGCEVTRPQRRPDVVLFVGNRRPISARQYSVNTRPSLDFITALQ